MEELIIGERGSGKTSTLINKLVDMKGDKVILVNTRKEADRLRAKLITEYDIHIETLMTRFRVVTYEDLLSGRKLNGFRGYAAADEPIRFLSSVLNNHGIHLTSCTINQDPSDIIFLPRSV